MRYVQNELCAELRAHAAFSGQKSLNRYHVARMKFRHGRSYFTHRHCASFKDRLPLDAGFDLHRAVREPDVHQRQPGGRVT